MQCARSLPGLGRGFLMQGERVMTTKIKTIDLELNDSEACALAQLAKRISFTELMVNAETEAEAYQMRDGISELQDALARHGYNPR